jgi:hypothetical protein
MSGDPCTALRWYLLLLMGGLLAQGLGSLAFRLVPALPAATPYLVRGIHGIDFRHAWIHILWAPLALRCCFYRAARRLRRCAWR